MYLSVGGRGGWSPCVANYHRLSGSSSTRACEGWFFLLDGHVGVKRRDRRGD